MCARMMLLNDTTVACPTHFPLFIFFGCHNLTEKRHAYLGNLMSYLQEQRSFELIFRNIAAAPKTFQFRSCLVVGLLACSKHVP